MFGIIIVTALLATLGRAQDCVLQVPANPLTAKGLATPYVQTNCKQREGSASFVECAIYDLKGGITYYAPLIIDAGDVVGKNFVAPIAPNLPPAALVGCWFGTNGASTTLAGPGAKQCTNGIPGSIFGQFAHCGGDKFMTVRFLNSDILLLTDAQKALADAKAGIIQVPALGTASIGGPCPTTRDARIVDQDQSDNVLTEYAIINGTILAQATPAIAAGGNDTMIINGSDNVLVNKFVDPALGCTPWMVPSITATTGMISGLATNELLAAMHQGAPVMEVPPIDPMVLDGNGNLNLVKTNLYRMAVGQAPLQSLAQSPGLTYCNDMTAGGIFSSQNQQLLVNNPSPAPDAANNLFTFLAQRFAAAIGPDNLNCLALWNITVNPVTLTTDGNGVVTDATINVPVLQALQLGQTATNTTATATSSATKSATASVSSATSVASKPTSVLSSSTSSFTGFRNTTSSTAKATATASSSGAIVSLTSNGNKGATLTVPTTMATVVASNTQTNVAVGSSTTVLGGGTGTSPSSIAAGGGTGTSPSSIAAGGGTVTSSAVAVLPSSTCTCPVLAAPTAPAAAAPTLVLLPDGLVKNTQTGQLFFPLPPFFNNLVAGAIGGQQGHHRL
jgi:hypothetical protein